MYARRRCTRPPGERHIGVTSIIKLYEVVCEGFLIKPFHEIDHRNLHPGTLKGTMQVHFEKTGPGLLQQAFSFCSDCPKSCDLCSDKLQSLFTAVLQVGVISPPAAKQKNNGKRSCARGTSTPADNYMLARRRTLQVVVSSLLTEAGFDSAEKAAVESLTEMLQSYLSEIGRSAKSYCEHTARTQPTLPDIVVTLIEMGKRGHCLVEERRNDLHCNVILLLFLFAGFNVDSLPAYAKRSQRMVITAPPVTNNPVVPKALSAGDNKPHPAHIPSHFPEFPDPHTYIKTPTYREPVCDYQVLREKAASQRRDVERALTRFMAKTGETQSLFKDDTSTFPCELLLFI
ncbi:hypothetical protein XELAEV_18014884mg [Xenopus laevis]|uniref:Transcription initiation factor TFIID subunit 8 n=1 Tax=Xenopus laevis TaxID=8355 RepID=A0A974DIM7_XENLA|nr:hypothetical protein XELAEV_18014884mg [Xenopus laevis]